MVKMKPYLLKIAKYMTKNEIYQYYFDFQSLTRHSLQRLAHI